METTTLQAKDFPAHMQRRVKSHAAIKGKKIAEIITEALEMYFKKEGLGCYRKKRSDTKCTEIG